LAKLSPRVSPPKYRGKEKAKKPKKSFEKNGSSKA